MGRPAIPPPPLDAGSLQTGTAAFLPPAMSSPDLPSPGASLPRPRWTPTHSMPTSNLEAHETVSALPGTNPRDPRTEHL